LPTATQSFAAGQDTPTSSLAGAGFGVGWIDHRDPFHRSARVCVYLPPPLRPTAVHARRDEQETPHSAAPAEPRGLGVGWMLHRRPSHRSASVMARLPGRPRGGPPTAVHALADVHDTPFS